MKALANSFLIATQFLTRLPVRPIDEFSGDALAGSAVFFPVVGLLVGSGGVLLHWILAPRAAASVIAVVILIYLVLVTGGLHEDALADAADGFGGGWNRERILEIMRDSRVGSFGTIAVALGLLSRFVFLTNLPIEQFSGYLLAGQLLGRWTALPLAYFLPAARGVDGLASRLALKVGLASLTTGTLLSLGIMTVFLKAQAFALMLVASAVVVLAGAYYKKRIGGITGDCLGATIQITETTVYFIGVIIR